MLAANRLPRIAYEYTCMTQQIPYMQARPEEEATGAICPGPPYQGVPGAAASKGPQMDLKDIPKKCSA